MQTFQLDKHRTFVSGLFWQPLSGGSADMRRETRTLATELDFDLGVWRTNFPQVGLASRSNGAKSGFVSAAAVIASSIEKLSNARDFLCAVQVPDGQWLYVAQRDGVILPDGDLIDDEDVIKTRLLQDISLGNWELVYAPDSWGITGKAQQRNFEDFLTEKRGKIDYKTVWDLQPINKLNPSIRIGSGSLILILCALGAGGWYGYQQYQEWQSAKLAAELAASGQLPKLPHPWKDLARAPAYLKACRTSMSQVVSLWPGDWTPGEGRCAGNAFNLEWSRGDHGWIEHLLHINPKMTIANDGNKASLSVPINIKTGEDELVPTEAERTLAMNIAAQKYGFKISLSPVPPPPPPPPPKDGEPPAPVPDWREINWAISPTTLPPEIMVQALESQGFRIKTIKSTFSNGRFTWSLEGTQYVQL